MPVFAAVGKLEAGRISEADLSGHLGNANGNDKKKSKAPESKLLAQDNQLYEALTLLKGINILGMREKRVETERDAGPG